MYQFIIIFLLIKIFSCQQLYFSTPVEFRGLWCINQWNNKENNYSQQIGQAFFYNNETFTLNFLNNIKDTWIYHIILINKTDNQGTYQILTNTSKGPSNYLNKVSCFSSRQISNGDIILNQESNNLCSSSYEINNFYESIRLTRNALNCHYINDENSNEILSNTPYEYDLLEYDKSLGNLNQHSIVFYGSSSIRLWSTLEKDFSNNKYNIINRGFGGSTLKQCFEQFKRIILPLEPHLLILYAGENDIAENQTPLSIQLIFRQFIPLIRRFFPLLPIAFISIKPSPSRIDKISQMNITNYLIQEDIKNMSNIYYIDIFNEMLTDNGIPRRELFLSDNLHMNEQGYAIWIQAINNYFHMNGFISTGVINCKISLIIFAMNFLVFFF